MLEYHSYIFTDFIDINMFVCKIVSIYDHFSGGNLFELVHAAQESRFTASGRSDDNDYFTFMNVCGDILQDFQRAEVFFKCDTWILTLSLFTATV